MVAIGRFSHHCLVLAVVGWQERGSASTRSPDEQRPWIVVASMFPEGPEKQALSVVIAAAAHRHSAEAVMTDGDDKGPGQTPPVAR
jgi:hypothetical protein